MVSATQTFPDKSERETVRPFEPRRANAVLGISLIVTALAVAGGSFAILLGATPIAPDSETTSIVIGVNAVFVSLLVIVIIREVARIVSARRKGKAASRLHVRIVTLFALVAAVPAVLVAIVASTTLNVGLDRWFEIRTRTIVNSSLSIADAYVRENASSLQNTTLSMANDLDRARTLYMLDKSGFRQLLTRQARGRALAHAALIDETGAFVMQADTDADFEMPPPPEGSVEVAQDGRPVLIEPRLRNIVGAIIKLNELEGLYLFTVRLVDPEVIRARQIVGANVGEYRTLEENRTSTQIAFALLYLGVTLVVVLAAIWTGIAVADRLVRPIRELIGAADEVSQGNLSVAVPVRSSDGDMASLGFTFNEMTHQLDSQRNELLAANAQIDERRRFNEAVLAGVNAGVIGVDHRGCIAIVNRSGRNMLSLGSDCIGRNLSSVLPHIGQAFENARASGKPIWLEQVTFYRRGVERTFNVQTTVEDAQGRDTASYVVTIDDITDLVVAQRSNAWADVARRIAHEIKNPLTPIQLSAERIARRYGRKLTEDREVFDQCIQTIVRQVGDIGRMVDEFSAFARMPKPELALTDLREPLKEATFLQEVSRNDIAFTLETGDEPLNGSFDTRLMSQAFGNLVKNAAEAIDGRIAEEPDHRGAVSVRAGHEDERIVIRIIDNGIGLPRNDRHRLLEPYMTTREKGTGLGLAIVRKIIEDHGGTLELHDAPDSFGDGRGAMVVLTLPPGEQQAARRPEGAEEAARRTH